jgi:tRNA threonylcarbamoyl adenosine modification protein TsaD
VLGIETSCDDTAAAVVSETGAILSETIVSSADIQAKWGGVVPALAQQAHKDAIDKVVRTTLDKADVRPEDLSGVAVTIGPGLSLCLKVGVLKAREISYEGKIPLIPVHHMEAHALVARLCTKIPEASFHGYNLDFPFLALLVSGGHNLLVLVEGVGSYKILGTTLDDAVGEAYDKVARLLGLDLSRGGGPAVEALALEGDNFAFSFPVPLKHSRDKAKNCDFSFAGLKTAVRMEIERCIDQQEEDGEGPSESNRSLRADVAASFQRVAIQHLCLRTRTAIGWARESHPEIKTLVVAGGVASNKVLRTELNLLAQETDMELVCPPPRYCTDNGVMVAWTGMERLRLGIGVEPSSVSAKPAEDEYVDLRPRWPLGKLDERCSQQRLKIRSMKTKGIKMSLTEETLLKAAEKAKLQRT